MNADYISAVSIIFTWTYLLFLFIFVLVIVSRRNLTVGILGLELTLVGFWASGIK